MSWPQLMPGPDALAEAPELAALYVLDVALGAATNALIAANVELQADDFVREIAAHPEVQACLADAVITHADSLQSALARYRDYLHQRARHQGSLALSFF
jgi:hypothetical protein